MAEITGRVAGAVPPSSRPEPGLYPLQRQFILFGLLAALVGGSLLVSPLASVALLVLFVSLGCLWRRGEPPILAFCIGYQWLFIVTGYFYHQLTGSYPGIASLGDLDGAVWLSLGGILALVAGIRLGIRLLKPWTARARSKLKSPTHYNVRRLFWYVVACNIVLGFVEVNPTDWFNAKQIIINLFSFRQVLLYVMFFAIIRQHEGYRYGLIALLYAIIPQLTRVSSGLGLIGLFMVLSVILLTEWRPWSELATDRDRSRRMAWLAVITAIALLFVVAIWEGALKSAWRHQVRTGGNSAPTVLDAATQLDWDRAVDTTARRLSSGVAFFSHVLWRVPYLVPHEDGDLTLRAIKHVTMPRIFFPDKPNLGADSWLVWTYAGLPASRDPGTSIGLGYMAEFYIDFGSPAMFLPLLAYGLLIGLIYRSLILVSHSRYFYSGAVTVILFQHFTTYEGEIAKLLGGMAQMYAVTALLLYVIGPRLHRSLMVHDTFTPPQSSCLNTLQR